MSEGLLGFVELIGYRTYVEPILCTTSRCTILPYALAREHRVVFVGDYRIFSFSH